MITINIICVGSLKEDYWKKACGEYEKRLSNRCKIKLYEIPEERLSDNPTEGQIVSALDAEAKKINAHIKNKSFVIALCVEGEQITSLRLAEKLSGLMTMGISSVNFIIGGSFGLSEKIKQASDFKFSMSELTFPHQLARVMLFEQLYRAFNINNGGKYNK